jgi:hypothetical protein
LCGPEVTVGLFPSPQEAAGAVVGLTPLGEVPDVADAVVFIAFMIMLPLDGVGGYLATHRSRWSRWSHEAPG